VSFKAIQYRKRIRNAKTNAQKKWAVKTRPFGREARIVALSQARCKPNTSAICVFQGAKAAESAQLTHQKLCIGVLWSR
jgi:hypothetical protein